MDKKYKNIAISGPIGSGKSTLAKGVAEKLGWKLQSTGEFFRRWHKEKGIPVRESDRVPEQLDKEIDMGYQEKMKNEEGVVFESHLAGWLAKDLQETFKVLCTADLQTRVNRVAARDGASPEEALKDIDQRAEAHREKFERLYGVKDRFNPAYFDLVVDTGKLNPQEALDKVLNKLED